MRGEDVCVRYCYVKQKEENVFIKLSAFRSAAIISTQLVASVYSPHELVIGDDALRTRDVDVSPILLLPEDCSGCRWLAIGGHDSNHFAVHPSRSCHLSRLNRESPLPNNVLWGKNYH